MIREVWNRNFDHEMSIMASLMRQHTSIAFDVEFPGFFRVTPREATSLTRYEDLKYNVDHLRPIQFGFTILDATGNVAGTWQYNFADFEPEIEFKNNKGICLSSRRSGINFEKQKNEGINSKDFGLRFSNILKQTGVNMKWVTFHGFYDLAYLTKILTEDPLPPTSNGFRLLLGYIFPHLFDMKHIASYFPELQHGELGLKKMAELLSVSRIGASHQAGSDSLLTAHCMLALKHARPNMDLAFFEGFIVGIDIKIERIYKPRSRIPQQRFHPPIFVRRRPIFVRVAPQMYPPAVPIYFARPMYAPPIPVFRAPRQFIIPRYFP